MPPGRCAPPRPPHHGHPQRRQRGGHLLLWQPSACHYGALASEPALPPVRRRPQLLASLLVEGRGLQ
eukprot:12012592-Alexandrium_andersonii.AAC.1